MMREKQPAQGFTLIELLVVVAIIGLLSSVVLASLNTARNKSRDAAIEQGVQELRTVMALEYNESASYNPIKSGGAWKPAGSACNPALFSGTYAAQASNICNSIMAQYPTGVGCTTNCLWFNSTNPNASNTFTIMAYLPGESAKQGNVQWYCLGSSGTESIGPTNGWLNPGCYANP